LRLINHLQAPVAARHPEIGEAIEAARQAGATGGRHDGQWIGRFRRFRAPRGLLPPARRLARPGWFVRATTTLSAAEAGRLMTL
jgi:hypothetical protein